MGRSKTIYIYWAQMIFYEQTALQASLGSIFQEVGRERMSKREGGGGWKMGTFQGSLHFLGWIYAIFLNFPVLRKL